LSAATEVNAKKSTLTAKDALNLLRDVDELYAAKGSKVVHLDLKQQKPGAEELKALVLGPTGNLRAPTLRVGRTLVVGFDAATYRKVFGT
jgi:arsenate reductase-like glutaredoxin family protein